MFLRSLTLFFGEDFSHRSSVYKFVRAYEQSRTNNRWKLNKPRTWTIILIGILYAVTPGLTRVTVGDDSETNDGGPQTFFNSDWDICAAQIGALIVNFIMVTSLLYCVEIQYKKQFDNYKTWMSDLTMLLNKTPPEDDALATHKDEEVVDIQSKGTALSKDLFISLTRRQNALGWLEIRAFLAVKGALLFGEQGTYFIFHFIFFNVYVVIYRITIIMDVDHNMFIIIILLVQSIFYIINSITIYII